MENDHLPRGFARLPKGVRAAARNLGWLLASRGVLAILSLVYLGVATRTLGAADFGRFALITGASQAIALLVGFQTWQIVVRYGVDHINANDEVGLAALLRACVRLDVLSALVGIALAILILAVWGGDFGITPDLMRATLIFAVVQLITIRSTPLGVLRLRDRFSLSALADSLTPLTRFVGAGLALALLPTVEGFLLAWAAAELVTAGAYWIILARTGDLRLLVRRPPPGYRLLAANPGLVRFTLSTNASSSLSLSTKHVPLLLVGGYVGPAAAGAFRLAFQIAQALAKLSQLLARAAFPEIVRAVRSPAAARLPRILARLFWASSAAAILILAIVAVAGKPILVLVGGNSFSDAGPLLLWLAAAGCVDLATVSFEPVLMAVHRAGTAMVARTAAVAVLLVTTVMLLPRMGEVGAGIGVLAGSLAGAVLLGAAVIHYAQSTRAAAKGQPPATS
ncbi:lipopolysaccharide biosynthesis protein [Hephaestia sp. GCM10023244]|uniref:lipopolysaccharide biosynthesis protein n=1 Tax=unclassified Hephaestia TaxID=2631281 RepID=UPI0020776A50|nr:lipopolysaccharide biosynthesis protein [Hephaestia sp. MAHUQ-44]MCM8730064.1 lipopolysaccharide biosynthesis protein [Hephaestia sp. MAHUQ-44]